MRTFFVSGAIAAATLGLIACSSNGYDNNGGGPGNPMTPGGSDSGGGIATINIVAIKGAQSFTPNPAMVANGQRVVWRNIDNTTHHIVFDNGAVDTGNIAAGRSSESIGIPPSGGSYHCTIHPEMVGSINLETVPQAPQDPNPSY